MNSKGALPLLASPPSSQYSSSSSLTGTVLRADVDGQILMRAYLSGTPECKFGLNDKLVIDKKCALPSFPLCLLILLTTGPHAALVPAAGRSSRHQGRSRTARWSSTTASSISASSLASSTATGLSPSSLQTASSSSCGSSSISFVFLLPFLHSPLELTLPPFHSYRSTSNINLPFRVQPIVEEVGKSRVEYTVHVKAMFQPKLSASNVVIKIPTPLNAASVDCKVGIGKAKYVPAENMIIWKCVEFPSFFP